jgi:hypothetical protein
MGTPRGHKSKFWLKMTPNVDIMQKSSLNYNPWSYSFNINCIKVRGDPINGHLGGRISTFGIIFGRNLGIWPPGMPIYRIPLNCYEVDYEDIASRFNITVFGNWFILARVSRSLCLKNVLTCRSHKETSMSVCLYEVYDDVQMSWYTTI